MRKSSKVFGRGSFTFIRPANRSVFAYVRQYQNDVLLCVANMSRSAQAAEIDLSPWRGRIPSKCSGRTSFPPIGESPYVVTLAPYGFYLVPALRDDGIGDRSAEHRAGIRDAGRHRRLARRCCKGAPESVLERDVLPAFLAGRRWFAERGNSSTTCIVGRDRRSMRPIPDLGVALIETKGRRETAQLPVAADHQMDPFRP